jgi:hypothetical protein
MVDPGFESRQRQKSLRIATSTPAVGPKQPSIERRMKAFWLGANWPGRKADHTTTSSVEVGAATSLTLHIGLHAV